MKIIYNVSSNTFKARDYNVDTIYIRYDEKYHKILDPETREKKEISKGEFDKLDISEREVNYTEEQYTYKEYLEKIQEEEIQKQAKRLDDRVKIEVGLESASTSMEILGTMNDLENTVAGIKNQTELESASTSIELLMALNDLEVKVDELTKKIEGDK